ncbi:hypothetical protein QWA68_007429 [Fusarium oxysporum]|nr:hypothetical protein QWA68_007429 [Fusarium oxysporum]
MTLAKTPLISIQLVEKRESRNGKVGPIELLCLCLRKLQNLAARLRDDHSMCADIFKSGRSVLMMTNSFKTVETLNDVKVEG